MLCVRKFGKQVRISLHILKNGAERQKNAPSVSARRQGGQDFTVINFKRRGRPFGAPAPLFHLLINALSTALTGLGGFKHTTTTILTPSLRGPYTSAVFTITSATSPSAIVRAADGPHTILEIPLHSPKEIAGG